MGWLLIPNNRLWEYDNAPADPGANSPYRPLWLKQTAGVRTNTDGQIVYTKVRKVGTYVDTMGEIAKTYWDVKGDDLKFQMEVLIPSGGATFTIPCQEDGGVAFSAIIDWGDDTTNSEITTYNDGDLMHTYAEAGTYTIKIDGTFPNIHFNSAGDRLLVTKVLNLGHVGWTKLNDAFRGCANLTEFSAGASDTSSVTTFAHMLRLCSVLTIPEVRLDTSSATSLAAMFYDSPITDLPGVETFDITNLSAEGALVTFMSNGAYGLSVPSSIPTERYDAMLIAWAAQASGVAAVGNAKFGLSQFTAGGEAQDARTLLINTFGIDTDGDGESNSTYTDGGVA